MKERRMQLSQYNYRKRALSIKQLSFALISSILIGGIIDAQELIARKPAESPKDFALRVIPTKTELAHSVVEGAFGPQGKNVVILFTQTESAGSNYRGWVMVPISEQSNSYKKYILPEMDEIEGHFEIAVQAVFFANADKDTEQELLVLYEYYRNGSGDESAYAVYAYDWNGSGFTSLEKVRDKLVGLATARAVRQKLKRLGY